MEEEKKRGKEGKVHLPSYAEKKGEEEKRLVPHP